MDLISDGQVTVIISLLINAIVFRSRVSDPSLKALLDFYKYTVIDLVDHKLIRSRKLHRFSERDDSNR